MRSTLGLRTKASALILLISTASNLITRGKDCILFEYFFGKLCGVVPQTKNYLDFMLALIHMGYVLYSYEQYITPIHHQTPDLQTLSLPLLSLFPSSLFCSSFA